ncbi:pyridoxamine 5'-phosphate oxidase [Avibacterium avium]|uniref:pyridoxamine 5'-phosphate oxidase n=1 Tax=Avibacterium avium TaxID=751 RepID=UPI003BF8CF13
MNLQDVRQEYSKQSLSENCCPTDPMILFEQWLKEAMSAQVQEPTAMNLATVDENAKPSSRIVLLKETTDQGFIFFTNYLSRKGRDISNNPFVALTLFWPELERQVRIEGYAERLSDISSDAYFSSRPYTSQIGAWASEQSAVISSKQSLLAKATIIAAKHPFGIPRPPHWGGYIVIPSVIEFWQGRPSRLHDRIRYLHINENMWNKDRLSP